MDGVFSRLVLGLEVCDSPKKGHRHFFKIILFFFSLYDIFLSSFNSLKHSPLCMHSDFQGSGKKAFKLVLKLKYRRLNITLL
jgi:hypothetical protein